MMDGLTAMALEKKISRQLEERRDDIKEMLTVGCEDTDSMETIFAKMVCNAIEISIKISAGLALDMLLELGLAEPRDEEQLRREIISEIKK